MKIGIGTESQIKVEAVQLAFPEAEIFKVVGFESVVPPQPIGKEQTKEGALGRANAAKEKFPDAVYCIGIENGKYNNEDGVEVDAACIAIVSNKTEYIWSDEIVIPTGENALKGGPNGEWSELKDPHSVVTNGKRPRKIFLSDALSKWREENKI